MTSVESNKNFEVIDNEVQINEKLANKEDNLALRSLKVMDSQIEKYDLDLVVDRTDNENPKYFFVYENNILDIPASSSEVINVWDDLVQLLNEENSLSINGKKDFRRIYKGSFRSQQNEENSLLYKGTTFDGNGLDENEAREQNIYVEKLYKFTQNIKGIPYEDWNVEWHVDRLKNLEETTVENTINITNYPYAQTESEINSKNYLNNETPEEREKRLNSLSNMYPEPEQWKPSTPSSI